MSKPTEITEASIKARVLTALKELNFTGENDPTPEQVDLVFKAGNFHEFVGIVEKATSAERIRAAGVCSRLGHRQTAAVIIKG